MHTFLCKILITFVDRFVAPPMLTAFIKCANHIEAPPSTFDLILLLQSLVKWDSLFAIPWEYKDVDELRKWIE